MTATTYDLAHAPLGGTLIPGGAIFRLWAPRATAVYISGDFNQWSHSDAARLENTGGGYWAGFVPGLQDGAQYLFYVEGVGSRGFKRDPRARKLSLLPEFPDCYCVLRNPLSFPWHDADFHPPAFNDLIIYQMHIGAFVESHGNTSGKFLDIIEQLPYLASLGVNTLQLLPIVEFPTMYSLGYNGTDYFSPEEDYGEFDEDQLVMYFATANRILQEHGYAVYPDLDSIRGSDNQLRTLMDLCHVCGISVLFDVVYNHGGGNFDPQSLYFLDRWPEGDNNESLYFTKDGWAGGLAFAYWQDPVKQFLIDNAKFFYEEYHVDGYRFDEVSVMDKFGGWRTCQDLTQTLRSQKPEAILIAEYWPVNPSVIYPVHDGGAGFDATWHDGLRNTIRACLQQSSLGGQAQVNMEALGQAMGANGLPGYWRAVQCIENHDIVREEKELRIARLADESNARSWYARSRSRVATGLLLTAPGIPMIFMGQEVLEDKQWNDNMTPSIWWDGLRSGDKVMADHLRFTRELISLRRRQKALRSERINVFHRHNANRVLAFHRWCEGEGRDVVVVACLNEATYYNYQLGFPGAGTWHEVFNSDIYDNWVNPMVAGNGGSVQAYDNPLHGLPASASITIPANSVLVFARDFGD